MLSVIGILVFLTAVVMPAINSIGSGNRLNGAARIVSNMMTIARSEAINSRVPVQLRIVTDKWTAIPGGENYDARYRKISLWKLDRATNSYVQFSRWETLPAGVVISPGPDPSASYAFPANDNPGTYFLSGTPDPALQDIATNGAVANAACFEFLPDGSLQVGSAASNRMYLLLVEGSLPEGQTIPVSTRAGKANWAQVRVAPLTGRISVVKP